MRNADDAYSMAAEKAIARTLAAERAAREAVGNARLEVERIVERARLDARAVDARTERRVLAVIAAFERHVAERLAEIDAAAEQVGRDHRFTDDEQAALERAVAFVAQQLTAAPP